MDKHSYLSNGDISAIEELYQQYKKDETSVDNSWKRFFEGFELARTNYEEQGQVSEDLHKEFKVINLINGYRSRGHLFTKTNPVRTRRTYSPTLAIENFGLEESDLSRTFHAGTEIGLGSAKLKEIIEHLETTYCRSIGVEYMYIRKPEKVKWLQEKMEGSRNTPKFNIDQKKHILHKLNQAAVFENFLHTKFVGQKRFSLEGCEVIIPAIDELVESGSKAGIEEFIFGMAHRGRLNVLANIFNKTYSDIFSEFEGKDYEDALFDGDVKYHLGYSCDITADSGKKVHMCLSPNPSHLEAVDPVVEGIARARIDDKYDGDEDKLVPVLIHGDAAIAGQGVVYEIVQMAQLAGYRNGGTIHFVINNQIGFTTNYLDGRSSTYCTDVGKVTLSPVFHVNGDDVEALVYTVQLALEYRQKFKQDVFIDVLCYRKYGHNEGDEPRFTQPLLYKAISKHPNPREIYNLKLTDNDEIGAGLAKEMAKKFKDELQERLDDSKQIERAKITSFLEDTWKHIEKASRDSFDMSPNTSVAKKELLKIAEALTSTPKDKQFFKKVTKILNDRQKMVEEDKLDWGMCELLAYGSLLAENKHIRFSGQDVERGTFSHRHAVLKVEDSEEEYIPLNNIQKKQGELRIYNSLLSEYAVLGFEYGYALASPDTLTIWEAQFGDFNNGAQIIIDQFLSSAEDKWKVYNGLVLLLPHGYEGQGAEHSSARMERYLQLCAEDNMQMANCTTPANFFHLLRRQLHWPFRKPLVVFTPKKLLRYPRCVSKIDDLVKGKFQEVIDDTLADAKDTNTVVFTSGKFYYDLLERKEETDASDLALIRIEQLYPLPVNQIEAIIEKYKNAENWIWAQEEPENMGPWTFMMRKFPKQLELISRKESASPATGSHVRYQIRHKEVIDKVFTKSKQAVEMAIE